MLDTDASAYQLGVELLKNRDTDDSKSCEPNGYFSKGLKPAKKN